MDMENWEPVELRCMIQDILGSEVYCKNDNPNDLGDRTIFYCITIPGENEWVRSSPKTNGKDFLTSNEPSLFTTNSSTATSNNNTSSNSASNDHSATTSGQQQPLLNDENSNSNSNSHQQHSNSNNGVTILTDREKTKKLSLYLVNLSFPIPIGKKSSCLIKVYDMKLVENLRVNDLIHVSGFLEPIEFDDDAKLLTTKSSAQNGDNQYETTMPSVIHHDDFEPACDFSHRLVPRVHVQKIKKVKHINPLLPEIITRDKLDINTIRLAKARLTTFVTQLLGGDALASEYLIMSLIAKIHRRETTTSLGQFSIGISGFKPEMKFLVSKLYNFISRITTHSHYIDLSIAQLNSLRFTPSKDIDNNKMIAGTLQLPDGLCLFLNETALAEGQLNSLGLQNIEALGNIISWQRLTYDFKFHSVQIDTDLKVLVISEGKSILPVTIRIQLKNNDAETISAMEQACESVDAFLTDETLNMFRYYITSLIEVPEYTIPADVKDLIEQNFIDWRKNQSADGERIMSADDLSVLMTTARYQTISRGETMLTREIWQETYRMDAERQARLCLTQA